MCMSPDDIPEENREKARQMLLNYFGGEMPEYFVNCFDEWFFTHVLSEFLTKAERGNISWDEFDSIKQETYGTIEMYKEQRVFAHALKYRKLNRAFRKSDRPKQLH